MFDVVMEQVYGIGCGYRQVNNTQIKGVPCVIDRRQLVSRTQLSAGTRKYVNICTYRQTRVYTDPQVRVHECVCVCVCVYRVSNTLLEIKFQKQNLASVSGLFTLIPGDHQLTNKRARYI